MLKIAHSPIYKLELPDGHRFPMLKYELICEQLLYEGTVTNDNIFHPKMLTPEVILATDKLGKLKLTQEGCRQRDRLVFEMCKKNNVPVSVSMGGGYSPRVATIVEAHANTFRSAQSIFF